MITVYVDVLFLINFSIDYIVLLLTSVILHMPMKKWRGLITAISMSLYGLWALLICGSYILLIMSSIASVALACRMAYPIRTFRMQMKCMVLYTGLAFLLGGFTDILFRFVKQMVGNIDGERDGRQVIVFALLAVISGVMIHFGNRLLDRGCRVRYINSEIRFFDKKLKTLLLVDSGNMVIEPLSGRHVIFLTEKFAEKSGLNQYIYNNEDFLKIKRIVCMDTASGKKAITAYLCDEIHITDKVVCGAVAVLSLNSSDIYDGIFPSALL